MAYGEITPAEVIVEAVGILVQRTARRIERDVKQNRTFDLDSAVTRLNAEVAVLTDHCRNV